MLPLLIHLCKKISHVRSTKSPWWNKFVSHLILFPYQNLNAPSFCSFSPQHDAVSSSRLISMVISASEFHTAAWCNLMVLWCRTQFPYFFRNADTAVGQSGPLCLCHFSITIVAPSIIFLLASQLLMLFSNVNVWKVFFPHVMAVCQALRAGFVHGQLKINWSKLFSTCNSLNDILWVKLFCILIWIIWSVLSFVFTWHCICVQVFIM
jgi:hypothetical protein